MLLQVVGEVPDQARGPSPDLLGVAGSPDLEQEVPNQAGQPSPDLFAVVGSPDLLADQSQDDLDTPPVLPATFTPGRLLTLAGYQ